jgi:hypothetical protein
MVRMSVGELLVWRRFFLLDELILQASEQYLMRSVEAIVFISRKFVFDEPRLFYPSVTHD